MIFFLSLDTWVTFLNALIMYTYMYIRIFHSVIRCTPAPCIFSTGNSVFISEIFFFYCTSEYPSHFICVFSSLDTPISFILDIFCSSMNMLSPPFLLFDIYTVFTINIKILFWSLICIFRFLSFLFLISALSIRKSYGF